MSKTYGARTTMTSGFVGEFAATGRSGFDQIAIADLIGLRKGASASGGPRLLLDGLRQRPRYFNGRFLTGEDLTRDQSYIRQRQADVARAVGFGVIDGLGVSEPNGGDGSEVLIAAGHGVTPSGALVVFESSAPVKLADLPASRELDSRYGISIAASQPLAKRRGLFILALRPVEYEDNPIAAYPTSVNGARSMAMGDIVEATVVTLSPVGGSLGAVEVDRMRGEIARDIFCRASASGELQDALPIAMVALEHGAIRWLDVPMVRREIGGGSPLQAAIAGRPRAVAEAHLLQYDGHLNDILRQRGAIGLSASAHFAALPPAGRLPLAAVTEDGFGFLQSFFPPSLGIDVGFAAADELAALVEESLSLPPIDLSADANELASTRILILMPVERETLRSLGAALPSGVASASAAAPSQFSGVTVSGSMAASDQPTARAANAGNFTPWRAAWAAAAANMSARREEGGAFVWYVRRRAVASPGRHIQPTAIAPSDSAIPVTTVNPPVAPAAPADTAALRRATLEMRIKELDLGSAYERVLDTAQAGKEEVQRFFLMPSVLAVRPVLAAALDAFSKDDPGNLTAERLRNELAAMAKARRGHGFLLLQAAVEGQEEIEPKASRVIAEFKPPISVADIDAWLQKRRSLSPERAKEIAGVLNGFAPDKIKSMLDGS